MSVAESKALQAREKAEVSAPAEQTRPGLVFTPAVDIFETEKEITLLADMPGVKSETLNIHLHENVLTLDGDVEPPEGPGEVDVLREYRTGKYYRQFTLSQVIDQDRIEAGMTDGVLRLILPKVEEATPRKIKVKSK
ncbi:MAG: Hsp20/alpha crystallin family protein [Deltaproteobacteria bacterium]|nr:Hsp20/alpha crystallin family protein [Deltaproteobacteria bacterium]MBW1924843.1 Hsp20/alpha crystallin family protein [Deltaproteobacteria bacterium]MBW1950487.1 Hsp20/alpha crystallin family protein [Deltaproteobacteria bacterium]MBW2008066.1 Hsp20/alpha crystallin family protein [Deltaproteobacteria bacterium]MBW2102137.1 Hsp20/alpha crystallin family protein [Deltaproteobacteria bacterium]